jgi:putative oxidoreductase
MITKYLTQTSSTQMNLAVLLLRLAIGIILFGVGAEKVLGWFGGKGLEATVISFQEHMGMPPILAYLSCFTEFLGGLCLAIGLLTRPAAFAVAINMAVATIEVLPKGFIGPGGAAFPFSLMMVALALLLTGGLAYSLDSIVFRPRSHASSLPQPRSVRVVHS